MKRSQHLVFVLFIVLAFGVLFFRCSVQNDPGNELFYATQMGDLGEVQMLLAKGAPINYQIAQNWNWTPLIGAVFAHHTNIITYLVDSGADVNIQASDGKTALIWLTFWNDEESVPYAKDLISHGANLNLKDKDGVTVLII